MRNQLCLLLCLILNIGFSQNQERILLEKELVLQEYLDNIEKSKTLTNTAPNLATQQREMMDADDDGMDDQWELDNGLDPNDNRDAYLDKDGDFIKNMFEFQLSTDPNSISDPQTVNYDGSVGTISQLLDQGVNGMIVIRVAGGDYYESHLSFSDFDTRIMIQGGWSPDFTDHNPKNYPTRFIGELNNEILYFGTFSGSEEDIENFILVLEGLEVTEGGGTFGNVNFITRGTENNVLCLYNCKLTNGTSRGMTGHHWRATTGKIYIANTEFSNNGQGGFYNQTTAESDGNWRLYNVTSTRNQLGINTFELSSTVTIKAVNCIFLENSTMNLDVSNSYTMDMQHSNYTAADLAGTFLTETNTIEEDPQFVDPFAGDFSLTASSPCINTGLDVGLAFAESAPEMGAYEFGDIMSANNEINSDGISFKVSPNLISIGQNISFACNADKFVESSVLKIYNSSGVLMFTQQIDSNAQYGNIAHNLKAGTYIAQLLVNGQARLQDKFVVY